MIINNLPTEYNFFNFVSQDDLELPEGFNLMQVKPKSKLMMNNVLNEIEELNQKKLENEVDYVTLLVITDSEYKKSEEEAKMIIDELCEEDIVDVLSIRKLYSAHKHIIEIFSYMMGEPYFEWKMFKEKLNLHEAKFKMSNFNLKILNKRMVNCHLNKISRNKALSSDTDQLPSGLLKIFRWIKAVIKIYLYKNKQKLFKENEDKLNSRFSSNEYSRADLEVVEEKIVKLELTEKNKHFRMKSNIVKQLKEQNSDLFFTEIKSKQNSLNPIKQNLKFEVKDSVKLPKINKKIIKLNMDITKEKIIREKKTLLSLPFLKYKTFPQLRSYFELLNREKSSINEQHYEEIEKLSLKNPSNANKVLQFISSNRTKEVSDECLTMFIRSLKEDDEVIKPRRAK